MGNAGTLGSEIIILEGSKEDFHTHVMAPTFLWKQSCKKWLCIYILGMLLYGECLVIITEFYIFHVWNNSEYEIWDNNVLYLCFTSNYKQ